MPLELIRSDITTLQADAIVNAANTSLQPGGGVCGAIFAAAGHENMRAACEALTPIAYGEAVLTPGFALPARYVIHAAAPVWYGGAQGEEALLRACYRRALALALEQGCESIAFPLLASGAYGYPKAEALAAALSELRGFLQQHDMQITLVLFDKTAYSLSEQLLGEVRSYVDEHYVALQERKYRRRRQSDGSPPMLAEAMEFPCEAAAPMASLAAEQQAFTLDEPFTAALFRLIDSKGKSDVEVYKRANLDRRLFSKIRSNPRYCPSKRTALALAVALELSLAETRELLDRAGYSLSRSHLLDVIVEYFIAHRRYDIFEINEVLFQYDQALLGG